MLLPPGWWVCVALLVPDGLPAPSARLDHYFASAASTLDPRPKAVLGSIANRERRMLAIAQYLRQRHLVDTLWTWNRREIRAHQKTEQYRDAMTQLRQVKRTFAALNPGYVLVADTNGRSLEAQVALWNRERSVAAAARELHDSCSLWLSDDSYPDTPDGISLARFLERMTRYSPARLPTVAVPGLSLHGRVRAIDFTILRRGRVVAGTWSATVDSAWDRAGWTERLRLAVTRAGSGFTGPLEAPREPWHYELPTRKPLP